MLVSDLLVDPIVELSECNDVVGESLGKLPPRLWPRLLPDLGGELQLDRVNVAAVPGAMNLSDPAAPVVLVIPGSRLSEVDTMLSVIMIQNMMTYRGEGTALYPDLSNIAPRLVSPNKTSSTCSPVLLSREAIEGVDLLNTPSFSSDFVNRYPIIVLFCLPRIPFKGTYVSKSFKIKTHLFTSLYPWKSI